MIGFFPFQRGTFLSYLLQGALSLRMSWAGRRTTGNVVQEQMSMEELDLMDDPFEELGHLRKLARTNPTKRFDTLYRLICHPEMLAVAAERVRQNTGGRTAGIDGQTRKQIDPELLKQLAQELKQDQYHPQAVRRVYIPKGKTGRRALGIPAIRDRIVQAAVAQVLEGIYEPLFRDCSYGFRPKRNTIQALRQVAQAYRAGATWTIEGDLVKCFDSIPHGIILNCLRKRIKDERFIDLIRQMLQAGVMEEGSFQPTYSGTPQGGLASPPNMHDTNAIWCAGGHNSPDASRWGDRPQRDCEPRSNRHLRPDHRFPLCILDA